MTKTILVNVDGTVEQTNEAAGLYYERAPSRNCYECGQRKPTRFYKLAQDYARDEAFETKNVGNVVLVYLEVPEAVAKARPTPAPTPKKRSSK